MSLINGDYEGKSSVGKNIYAEMSKNLGSVQDASKIANIDLIFHDMSPQMQAAVQIFGAENAEESIDIIDRMSAVNIAIAD